MFNKQHLKHFVTHRHLNTLQEILVKIKLKRLNVIVDF